MAIAFVGSAIASKAGVASGDSTIALNSGLTGGSGSAVSAGDLVIAVFASGSDSDQTLVISDGTTGYTLVGSELYSNDSRDTNLRVAYKFMGGTPDTATTFGPTGDTTRSGVTAVYVFSGVDSTTPLDVAAVTATGIDTGRVDAGAVTPTTAGAVVVVAGAGTYSTQVAYTSSDLSSFVTQEGDAGSSRKIQVGIGRFVWTSGAFDPAQYGGGSTSTADSWAAVTIALRPASGGAGPQTLTPSLVTDGDTFYSPTITTAITLTPSLFTDGDTFYGPTITSVKNLSPPLVTDGDTFYGPVVSLANGPQSLVPTLFVNSNIFYGATVALELNNAIPTRLVVSSPQDLRNISVPTETRNLNVL